MPNRRKKVVKKSEEDMPVPKNGNPASARSQNSKTQEGCPENAKPRTADSPANGHKVNRQGKSNSGGLPRHVKTDGFPRSRDSSASKNSGKSDGSGYDNKNWVNATVKVDVNGNDNMNGTNGIAKVDLNGNRSMNGVSGADKVDGNGVNGTAKVDGNGIGLVNDARGFKVDDQGNKFDGHNGFHSRIYSKNKPSGPPKKPGGFRRNFRSIFCGNSQKNRPESNDELAGNGKEDVKPESGQTNDPSEPKALTNIQPVYADSKPATMKLTEKEYDTQSKDNAIFKKYSEEPLSFFQPDLGKSTPNDPESPSVEELCAKWPIIERKSNYESSNNAESLSAKDDGESPKSSPVHFGACLESSPVSSQISPYKRHTRWEAPELAPRFAKNHQKGPTPVQSPNGPNNDRNQFAEQSSHGEHSSAGSQSSWNFHGSSGRSKQFGDSGHHTWNKGQFGSPCKYDQSSFTPESHSGRFFNSFEGNRVEREGVDFRIQFDLNQGRGQNGPQSSFGRGGQKRNKNGRKFNNQNGNQNDKKLFGRPRAKSPMDPNKAGAPVGYYPNYNAYVGQNLVSVVPPLMGPPGVQPQMGVVQPQMVSPAGTMPPQMLGSVGPQMLSPAQFEDEQYTMAIFPNGYLANHWIDMGSHLENQQVLVQTNGEVVPLTMANMMPYIVPYTPGLPNAGVPLLIPAVAPPLGTDGNGQTANGHERPASGQAHQMDSSAHPNEGYVANNTQLYGFDLAHQRNMHGNQTTDLPHAQAASHSVSSHIEPISASSESPSYHASWHNGNCGTPARASTSHPGFDTPDHAGKSGFNTPDHAGKSDFNTPVPARKSGFNTPDHVETSGGQMVLHISGSSNNAPGSIQQNQSQASVSFPAVFDRSTPVQMSGPPLNDTASMNGTPGPDLHPGTPQDPGLTNTKDLARKVKMISVSQIEKMQMMSSTNGKRVPIRSKDSPNHVPPAPQEVQEELVKFIFESWNKVNQEYQKGSSAVAFYDSDPCPLEGFVPFDLEAHWGKRLVQNMTTNQNIPTQNI